MVTIGECLPEKLRWCPSEQVCQREKCEALSAIPRTGHCYVGTYLSSVRMYSYQCEGEAGGTTYYTKTYVSFLKMQTTTTSYPYL